MEKTELLKFQEDCRLVYDYYKKQQAFKDYVAFITGLCEIQPLQDTEIVTKHCKVK